jgi:hypothetical protein
MVIADLMTRNIVTCRADDRLDCPAGLMWKFDVGRADRQTKGRSSKKATRPEKRIADREDTLKSSLD